MLNQISAEALYSATFVENYMDCIENLPDDAQRHLSRIRDIDVQVGTYLRDVECYLDQWIKLKTSTIEADVQKSSKLMAKIQKAYINAQELGDEKMQTVSQLQELIDQKTRQVDLDYKNLDYGKEDQLMETTPIGIGTGGIGSTNTVIPICGQSGNINSQKTPRPSSPSLSQIIQSTSSIKVETCQQVIHTAVTQNLTATVSSTLLTTQRGNTPTITEKTSNNNTPGGGNNNNNNTPTTEPRTTSKRSRRPRNEISITEVGGNESNNSANESGNNKQNAAQSTINNAGGNSGSGNSAGNCTASGGTGTTKKTGNQTGGGGGKKNKKRGAAARRGQGSHQNARDTRDDTPPPDPIDPDEPTYCLCDQISFGEMILCDNDLCPIEWFHFSCVALMSKPKGKWFCPNCRGDRPNVMKPKAQFLKELERYNKEKEEKT